MAPGAIVYTGRSTDVPVGLTVIRYDGPDVYSETAVSATEVHCPTSDEGGVLWLNVDGVHDTTLLTDLGRAFGLHPLALEDIANVGSRPQISDYDDYLMAIATMLWVADDESLETEQVSLILGPNWVISFQEEAGDVFLGVRDRIREGRGRIRTRHADYLWYALLDAIVDHYMIAMDHLAERTETLEQEVWDHDDAAEIPARVQELQREMLTVRRALRPIREQIESLALADSELVDDESLPFFADLKDHILHLGDSLEGMRDGLSTIMDIHFSILSNRMNEVMKVLTIMASIFIPITFVAGVYGMNFSHMPELDARWAYPTIWIVMVTMVIIMLSFFKRRGWL